MTDWKITKTMAPHQADEISDVVKRQVAAEMGRRIERTLMDTFASMTESAPLPPLTSRSLVRSMAEAIFDAQVIISTYAPAETTNAAGETGPVAAFVIDNTQLPDWDMRCAIAKAKGEPAPKASAIIFPSEDKALEVIEMAMKRREGGGDGLAGE